MPVLTKMHSHGGRHLISMKTKDRILETSLILFNEEGDQSVSTVDIANEMDISPGNLYYHFKGKEVIIDALFDDFEAEMTGILRAPIKNALDLQDHWFYLYVVYEEIYKFRFFYMNLTDILRRNPELERRFRRLVNLKREAFATLCKSFVEAEIMAADEFEISQLAESVVINLNYWFSYQKLMQPDAQANQLLHGGVYQIMSLIGPHFVADSQLQFYSACKELYEAVIQR